jgi:DNA repair exonuclease SbcCD ATPase subunit
MNASSRSFPGSSSEEEVTAELPVLDIAAYEARQAQDPLSNTDTWATPTLNTAILPQLGTVETASHPAPPVTPSAALASKLEVELRSLASNLSELETRLAAKGERITVIETELAESRAAGLAAAERAVALSAELTGTRAAVAAATTQIEGQQATIREHEDAIRIARDRETELRESLERREAEFSANAAREAARAAEQLASHEAARKAALQQVAQMQAANAAQLETLQSMEGRRGIFDSILRTLDTQIVGRDEEQARLVADLARNTTHGLQLTRDLDSRTQRVTQLQTEVAALNASLGASTEEAGAVARTNRELNESLQSLREERAQRATRIAELDAQLGAGKEAHAQVLGVAATAHSDLKVANTALQLLREESAQRAARIAELDTQLGAGKEVHAQLLSVAATAHSDLKIANTALQSLREETAQRAARIADLEAQLIAGKEAHAQALSTAATAHSDLQADNAALLTKQSELKAEIATAREQLAEHARAEQQFAVERAQRLTQIGSCDAQISALTTKVAMQAQTIEAEAELGRANQERISIAENDLRASEHAINRLESDVRSRNIRVEELTRINSLMLADIEDARRWLAERDSLMQRLETEAAHSATLVDNIQRSIRSLAPGNTGSHEVAREAVGARLLVRSQDGHEVVHVLGRKTTIGRTPDNDLQIDASFISRHHAVLLVNGPQTIIEDLNSTNGVFINGHRINREAVNDGDLVMVGKARFRFVIRPAVSRTSAESSG